jgi:uncharacterized protein
MKPRELSDDECASLLSAAKYGRLGLSNNDQPYVIPMSYVYHDDKIFLHSRGKGKKVEYVTKNPRVCFQVDAVEKGRWSSVLISGRANLSDDIDVKMKMFEAFMGKDMQGHGGKQFKREDLEKMPMTIWEIKIEEMAGREGIW